MSSVFIVISSSGSYEEYREVTEGVYSTKELADSKFRKVQEEQFNKWRKSIQFDIDYLSARWTQHTSVTQKHLSTLKESLTMSLENWLIKDWFKDNHISPPDTKVWVEEWVVDKEIV